MLGYLCKKPSHTSLSSMAWIFSSITHTRNLITPTFHEDLVPKRVATINGIDKGDSYWVQHKKKYWHKKFRATKETTCNIFETRPGIQLTRKYCGKSSSRTECKAMTKRSEYTDWIRVVQHHCFDFLFSFIFLRASSRMRHFSSLIRPTTTASSRPKPLCSNISYGEWSRRRIIASAEWCQYFRVDAPGSSEFKLCRGKRRVSFCGFSVCVSLTIRPRRNE